MGIHVNEIPIAQKRVEEKRERGKEKFSHATQEKLGRVREKKEEGEIYRRKKKKRIGGEGEGEGEKGRRKKRVVRESDSGDRERSIAEERERAIEREKKRER